MARIVQEYCIGQFHCQMVAKVAFGKLSTSVEKFRLSIFSITFFLAQLYVNRVFQSATLLNYYF